MRETHGGQFRRRCTSRRLTRTLLTLGCSALAGLLASAPHPALGQPDAGLQQENQRLRDENERLRQELEALRTSVATRREGTVAGDTRASNAANRAAGTPTAIDEQTGTGPPKRRDATTEVETAYVPMSRVSLTVSRDADGRARIMATPWYRTVDEGSGLPRREFIQLRAAPAQAGGPEQVWMRLQRRGVHSVVDRTGSGRLRIGNWSGEVRVVDQEVDRRRRRRHQGGSATLRDELVVFALPAGSLERLAISDQSTFEAGPVEFTFTDEHVAAAAGLADRLSREKTTSPATSLDEPTKR